MKCELPLRRTARRSRRDVNEQLNPLGDVFYPLFQGNSHGEMSYMAPQIYLVSKRKKRKFFFRVLHMYNISFKCRMDVDVKFIAMWGFFFSFSNIKNSS